MQRFRGRSLTSDHKASAAQASTFLLATPTRTQTHVRAPFPPRSAPPCPHALLPCTTTARLSLPLSPHARPLTTAPGGGELASEAADAFPVTVSAAAGALHFTFPLLTTLCISPYAETTRARLLQEVYEI